MRHAVTIGAFLNLMLFGVGCGYFKSGTWSDDPKNWERAFDSQKPPDVEVAHSKYWRSPHWSYEFEYFFHIRANAKIREQLFTENKLSLLGGEQAHSAKQYCVSVGPNWFAPQSVEAYDVWGYANEPSSNFRVFIDKNNEDIFLTDYLR